MSFDKALMTRIPQMAFPEVQSYGTWGTVAVRLQLNISAATNTATDPNLQYDMQWVLKSIADSGKNGWVEVWVVQVRVSK